MFPVKSVRFWPLGEAAVTVELSRRISPLVNARCHALYASLTHDPLPGLREVVPAYASLTLHYDPLLLTSADLQTEVLNRLTGLTATPWTGGADRQHIIPVAYGGEAGPDLEGVAAEVGLSPQAVIAHHSHVTYRVYLIGFSPGFPYLGRTPACLNVSRLAAPRTRVPAGSVAIAGRQTGIYPSATPGGWRLLGRTGWSLFDPGRLPPARLQPGDRVRFVPATAEAAGLTGAAASPTWGDPAPVSPASGRPVIEVLDGGLLTTVQDGGRWGFQSVGVPVAGAVDPAAMQAANRLVGNRPDAPLLEITLTGPTLLFHQDALVAITGADLTPGIAWPDGQQWELPGWTAVYVPRGSYVYFAGRRSGCRAYLALAGGLRVPPVLGSASTCLAGGFGGYEGRPLQAGDCLVGEGDQGNASLVAGRCWPAEVRPAYTDRPVVRVLPGPQWQQFTRQAQEAFLSATYRVLPASDRVGLRLQGPALSRRWQSEVISSGVTVGSVQVPASGQPIVLMADRQTVGGYPQIAVVIGPDLPLLAQLIPGDQVSFRRVTLTEAVAAVRESQIEEERISRLLAWSEINLSLVTGA